MTETHEPANEEPPETDEHSQQQQQQQQQQYASIRILVLHDERSNAKEALAMLKPLDERLYAKHGIEFVYINAPLVVVGEEEGDDRKRVWWEACDEHDYLGLDCSLLHVQQIWKSTPFSGVLAIGQGVAIGSLLPMLEPTLDFGVFMYGKPLLEENEPMMAHWPCLHLVSDTQDVAVQRLVTQFPGQIHVSEEPKLRKEEFNILGKWFVDQKKEMRISGTGEELVLQTQLHLVEQEASRVMAERIAEDPPKALMAVIRPQQVSGWHGAKRREFGAEGGGAPCPSEFLLNREKRSTNPTGPTRDHPSARRDESESNDVEDDA